MGAHHGWARLPVTGWALPALPPEHQQVRVRLAACTPPSTPAPATLPNAGRPPSAPATAARPPGGAPGGSGRSGAGPPEWVEAQSARAPASHGRCSCKGAEPAEHASSPWSRPGCHSGPGLLHWPTPPLPSPSLQHPSAPPPLPSGGGDWLPKRPGHSPASPWPSAEWGPLPWLLLLSLVAPEQRCMLPQAPAAVAVAAAAPPLPLPGHSSPPRPSPLAPR